MIDPLTSIRHRDRALVLILEQERAQGYPQAFNWAAWRRSREKVVAKLRSHTYWAAKGPQALHRHLAAVISSLRWR